MREQLSFYYSKIVKKIYSNSVLCEYMPKLLFDKSFNSKEICFFVVKTTPERKRVFNK